MELFVSTLANQTNNKKLSEFFDDFFSPTEKIMFAKRLAAAVLLAKNHDYQSIHEILRISPPTIAKLSLKIKYGGEGLKPVIEDIFKKEANQIVWKEIESLFDLPTKGNIKSPERFKRNLKREQKIREIKSEF
ncbi:MAG: hypothetical protein UU16_C0028G0005 [Candidatus Woesebacteria bacterium GW2011_GWA2_40_7]|uniref:TrpR like protein, YerC/YecD n=1 Tax=Candidatus Woesebacteria bacterium GW2011_GWA2_40_7 TaxID=1618562 RepID=A0A0G0T884_9BACT|nr:MAG: hypothetical protein UU16_C0028G0005 [Candidatus Woesebacteria bacterium GW2011_GWA2_40_7]